MTELLAEVADVADVGDDLQKAEHALALLQKELNDGLLTIPNLPHESVPMGASEDDNVVVRQWGEQPTWLY